MSSTETNPQPAATEPSPASVEEILEHAKRAFALRKYEQAVDHYATALELVTTKHGDNAPETADLYFLYGKALLENAIAQSSVLGKDQTEDAVAPLAGDSKGTGSSGSGAFLSFSGDPEDLDDDDAELGANDDADGEEEEEGEPEDDFNAAWEVLDLARAIYEKQDQADESDGDAVRLKLADTYIALGDVSLETEKFDQAITDYSAALKLKSELLPVSSRQIAEAHYKLSIVLDLTAGRLGDAVVHVERALESVEARLAELRDVLSGQGLVREEISDANGKGKGKATAASLAQDSIHKLSESEMQSEVKDLQGLREDLVLKIEELKTSPNGPTESAPAMAARALDDELRAATSGSIASQGSAPVVNDLTSVVKKKKKAPAPDTDGAATAGSSVKRKAEDEGNQSPSEKKTKLDNDTA